jgi:hypothetical protein
VSTTAAAELPFDALDLDPGEVRARFERARRDGRPAWLWPDVEPEAWRGALRAIESATRAVLSGATSPVPLRAARPALEVAAYTSGMGPLLGLWIEEGRLEADPATGALLRLHLHHNRRRMERLTRETALVAERLAEAGVVPVVLKGMHTAHHHFPEPGARPLSDADLLVPAGGMETAERVLLEAGYRPGAPQRRPYKRDWRPAGAASGPRSLSLTHADDPWSLDVHGSLARNFFGVAAVRLDAALPGSGTGPWSVTPAARVLGQPLLALQLATHTSEGLHALSLVRLVELALVLRGDAAAGALRWEALLDAADATGALRFAFPALELCERLLPGTVPGPMLERFASAATPAMRRVVAGLTPATAQRLDRLSLEERMMWAGSARERVRRAAHALWPAPAGRSLAELGRIYRRRAWGVLRGRVGR